MVAVLLLDEGSMFVFFFALIRFGLLLISSATLFVTVRRKPSDKRALAMLVAGLALAFGCLLPIYENEDPSSKYAVYLLGVPVLLGLYMVLAHPRDSSPNEPK